MYTEHLVVWPCSARCVYVLCEVRRMYHMEERPRRHKETREWECTVPFFDKHGALLQHVLLAPKLGGRLATMACLMHSRLYRRFRFAESRALISFRVSFPSPSVSPATFISTSRNLCRIYMAQTILNDLSLTSEITGDSPARSANRQSACVRSCGLPNICA